MISQKDAESIVGRCIRAFEEDKKSHDAFVTKADQRYRSFRGILEKRSKAAAWTSKQHPAYVFQSVETVLANLIDPTPKWKLRAQPMMTADRLEIERHMNGARANELLLNHQLSVDKWAEKQRAFDLQGLITGLTVSKQHWVYKEGTRKYLRSYEEPLIDAYGNQIGLLPRLVEDESPSVLRNNPTAEVVDVRDFIWHEGAISLARCQRVTHRVWYSKSELEELVAAGTYGPAAGGRPFEELVDTNSLSSELYSREQDLFEVERSKDQIEVLECWIDGGKKVVSIANRKLLLASRDNPFWFDHLEHPYPFVVCSGSPDLFRIPGVSEVELMEELQEMLWTTINQRLDNLQLLNNAIVLIADDVEDPDAYEFAPGERWLVSRPVQDSVQFMKVDPTTATISMAAEGMLKGDLQNITGGMPFLSGTDTSNIDQQTATGVSIITSLAQKRLAAKKQNFVWAKARIGEQWLALNQQFVRTDRLIPIIGQDGAQAFERISPDIIAGDYVIQADMLEDSLLRSERRAEAQAKLQVAVSSVGQFAATAQPLNLRAFMEDYLEAFDVTDKDRYFASQGPTMPTGASGQPGQPQAPAPPGPVGITAPQATMAQTSPSNEFSMSPSVFEQRARAMTGGVANGG